MCGNAASKLVEENSLGWAGGDDSLMMHKDFSTCTALKVLIKEKELESQRLHTHVPGILAGYYVKRFDLTMQPFQLKKSNKSKYSIDETKGDQNQQIDASTKIKPINIPKININSKEAQLKAIEAPWITVQERKNAIEDTQNITKL